MIHPVIIKTRKLPATQTEGERMRATADSGATLTIPFPYGAQDPDAAAANSLARAIGRETTLRRHRGAHVFELGATRSSKEL